MEGVTIPLETLTEYIHDSERLRILMEYINNSDSEYFRCNDIRLFLGLEKKEAP
jgi:hypothetical protein